MDMFDMLLAQKLAGGTSDYSDLTNKPQINGHTLSGNQTGGDLGLASESDVVTYLAGSNISISSVDRYVDLFEYAWSNVAPNSTTSWQTIPDSKSLTSAVISLESVTKFKLQAATKQTHTIFFSGAFVDSNDALHDFPSSALNSDGTIKQDTEIDVPSGCTGMYLTARLDNQAYQQGSDVHESDFDYIRIKIMEGTHSKAVGDQTKKIISVVPDLDTTYAKTADLAAVATSGSYNDLSNKPTLGTAAEKDMDSALSGTSTNPVQNNTLYGKFLDIDANIAALRVMMDAVLYGYRVDKNDSNPETRVSYMYDAVGMTPARMNYTTGTFDYGSWANAWFITGNKPVALKYDGTVDYELDPNDYSKKADGTASDVTDSTYAGNFMASMPTVWIRRWEDENYEYTAISNKQITPDFYADAHDNGSEINDMIYLPMFKGCIVDSKMRSLSGVTPTVNTTGSTEKTAAEACGSGWQLWDWAKHELISDLLTLISRSTDSQTAFGNGYISGSAVKTVGTSGAGQFWGANDQTHLVKVFHIEDFWGHRWDRCLGINLVDNQYAYKLVAPYLLEPDSTYTYSGLYAPTEGYQKLQNTGRYGRLPKTTGGSSTTFYCDYFNKNENGMRLGLCGGYYADRLYCGSRYLRLLAASSSTVNVGGSPCFNPPHEGV